MKNTPTSRTLAVISILFPSAIIIGIAKPTGFLLGDLGILWCTIMSTYIGWRHYSNKYYNKLARELQ